MSFPQARPTMYRGIQMRSRLEAEYAAFLDSDEDAGRWEYEPRAYANERGQYLPDFLIHGDSGAHYFVEVKPTVERALGVLERMEIILDSEPEAVLFVVIPGIGAYLRRPVDRRWRWFPEMQAD